MLSRGASAHHPESLKVKFLKFERLGSSIGPFTATLPLEVTLATHNIAGTRRREGAMLRWNRGGMGRRLECIRFERGI